MEKRAIIILSIIGVSILLLLAGFVFAQNSENQEEQSNQIEPISKEIELNEQIKEETSPRDVFMQYLQEKINELPDKEKQKFEKSREMNPIEIILKAAEKFQSQNQEEVNYLETSENDE